MLLTKFLSAESGFRLNERRGHVVGAGLVPARAFGEYTGRDKPCPYSFIEHQTFICILL